MQAAGLEKLRAVLVVVRAESPPTPEEAQLDVALRRQAFEVSRGAEALLQLKGGVREGGACRRHRWVVAGGYYACLGCGKLKL